MTQQRDVAIINARVRTVDDRDTVASALWTSHGRIAAVGSDAEIRAAAPPGAEIFDAGGRTVVPGFIDTHNHLSIAAFAPDSVDCSTLSVSTLDDLLEAIAKHCETAPDRQWVRAMRFNPAQITEQRGPTRYELDEVAPRNPVFLIDASCHAGWANSLALAAVGIDAHTPQPWGGAIEKDRRGAPTGTLLEAGTNLLHSASWNAYADRDRDHAVELLRAKMGEYLAVGITGVGDAMVTARAAELYRRADEAGALPLTVQQLHHGDHFFAMQDLRRSDVVEQIRQASTERLRGGALKIFADPGYPDGPAIDRIQDGCRTHTGSSFYTKGEIEDLAVRAANLGISTAIHAMGSCTVGTVLDAYEAVRQRTAYIGVLRIEHAFVAEPQQAARMADLAVDLTVNPGLGFHWGGLFDMWRGEDQAHLRVLPVRSMIDAGVRVSLASDHPCDGFSPAQIIWSAVTRASAHGDPVEPDEAITAADALRCYTINAAYASGRAEEEGSIEVGKRANLVVLDRDIVTCATDDIRSAQVCITMVDGEIVHRTFNLDGDPITSTTSSSLDSQRIERPEGKQR